MKRLLGILVLLLLFPLNAVFAENFDGHWAAKEIEAVQREGIMTGTDSGFMPDRSITRAEFVCATLRAVGAELTDGESVFSDVPNGKYYTPYINRAVSLGIISGFGDGTFRPENYITREEAVIVLSRAYGYLSGYNHGKHFLDYADIAESARSAVGYALKEKIIFGYEDNTLRPKALLTRAEAACLILRSESIERTEPGFIVGYPKLVGSEYAKLKIEIRTNMPCTVYYKLTDAKNDDYPSAERINEVLCRVTDASVSAVCEISGEAGKLYDISLVAVMLDSRYSKVVQLEAVMPCPYSEGDGSKGSPYAIYDVNGLNYIRYFSDKAFILKEDIALSGEWTPIPEFSGSIDGNGHKITGLYVNTEDRYAGLFGRIVRGEIKNLAVDGNVTARANSGIFAGELADASIKGCVASGMVKALTNNAGGFVGENSGRIENSLSSVYLVEASSFAGGIAGQNYGIIKNSLSAAHTVTANIYSGGIASVNLSGASIESSLAANIYVYDTMLDNCGRVAANRNGAVAVGNYAYSGMRTNSEDALNEEDNNNGADISWYEITDRDALCEKLGWDKKLWTGGSYAEKYLLPHPSLSRAPELVLGVCEYAPIRISRAAEMFIMKNNPNMHYMLVSDISFAGYPGWTPIADTLSEEEGFSGTFDGRGHTIYGLQAIKGESGLSGLFGMISSGEVRNLKLSDAELSGGNLMGTVAAISYGNITDCTVERLSVTSVEADSYIGGICGYSYANLQNCVVSGEIKADTKNTVIGGIVAHNEGFVDNVSFSGDIKTERNSGISESVVGGICGYNSNGMIYNAYAEPIINQKAAVVYSGGVCAIQNGGELYRCTASGSINCNSYDDTSVSYAGGVVALAAGGIVMHSYSSCNITQYTPRSYAGGIAAYNEGAVIQNGYSKSNIFQHKPYVADKEIACAGGICGYNENGVVTAMVAINKTIVSGGVTGRICASGTADSVYGNFAIRMSIPANGEDSFGGIDVVEEELSYEFFTKPITEGGLLGWSSDIWKDTGSIPVFRKIA